MNRPRRHGGRHRGRRGHGHWGGYGGHRGGRGFGRGGFRGFGGPRGGFHGPMPPMGFHGPRPGFGPMPRGPHHFGGWGRANWGRGGPPDWHHGFGPEEGFPGQHGPVNFAAGRGPGGPPWGRPDFQRDRRDNDVPHGGPRHDDPPSGGFHSESDYVPPPPQFGRQIGEDDDGPPSMQGVGPVPFYGLGHDVFWGGR